jgi:microcystin-dependent protein
MALAVACAAGAQPAPVPELLNYQGLVYLDSGSSDVNGTYRLVFRLYDAAIGGTLLWGEALDEVQVVNGHFNVVFGNGLPVDGAPHGVLSDVFKHSHVYLEIAVGTDEPIRVRQRFIAAPYAFAAQHAESAVHGVPPGTVAPFAGGQIPHGWLPCDGAAISKTDYPALYTALSDAGMCIWGESDAMFYVPNLGGRAVAGANAASVPGTRRGAEKHALTANELPAHAHQYYDKYWGGSSQSIGADDRAIAEDELGSTQRTTASTGGSVPHNEIQPSAVVNFIIKY